MSKYFFSYAGIDRPLAKQLVSGLQSAGIDIWWDLNDIGWGEHWQDELQKGLETCDAYILLLGKQGIRRWVKAEVETALTRHYEKGLPLFILLLPDVDRQHIPPFLNCIQHRSLPENLNDPAYFTDLVGELKRHADDPSLYEQELPPGFCPFPGLESFTEDRADFFFGRQRETAELLVKFARPYGQFCRWLQIEGNSGVGKSSLVQSALIPAIRAGWLDENSDRYHWQVWVMRPGTDACQSLVIQIANSDIAKASPPLFDKRIESILDLDGKDSTDLAFALKLVLQKDPKAKVLLIIDQLEELITLTSNPKSQERFDNLLATALTDPDCPLYLVTTIRSDFMLHFAELPKLQALFNSPIQERYFLQPIGEIGLTDAIKTPVRCAKGWSWQPGTIHLVDKDLTLPEYIAQEALLETDAALPLTSNVMKMLWEAATAKQVRELSFDDLKSVNGVGGALAASLDEKLQRLPQLDKDIVRAVLLDLVQTNTNATYTRRTITKTQALEMAGAKKDDPATQIAANRIINWLSGIRVANDAVAEEPIRMLVISGGKENESTTEDQAKSNDTKSVDLIHEILLRTSRTTKKPYCKTLFGWIKTNDKQLKDRDRRQDLANQWFETRKQSPFKAWISYLASWGQLKDFKDAGSCNTIENKYLKSSQERLTIFIAAWLLVSIAFTQLAFRANDVTYHTQYANLATWLLHRPTAWVRANVFPSPELPKMVEIPAGTFELELNGKDHKTITLSAFKMAETELTFAEYDIFVFANQAKKDAVANTEPASSAHSECFELPADAGFGRGDRPVINVTWYCANAYIAWLNKQLKLDPNHSYRLPSEMEWEYAIRANANPQKDYYWDAADPKEFAWFFDNSEGMTQPVREKLPNNFGFYDMSGNVWEWVQDCYQDDYKNTPTDGKPWNPLKCESQSRVLRGGSWGDLRDTLRSAYRIRNLPDSRGFLLIGFRLAQD